MLDKTVSVNIIKMKRLLIIFVCINVIASLWFFMLPLNEEKLEVSEGCVKYGFNI